MNNFIEDCTCAILAGGENRRMPVLKAFIEVEGQKIIERNLRIMKQLFKEIFIVTNQPEAYSYLGAPMLGDIYDIRGPMTGIFTALTNSSNNWIFITACDMPFINKSLIEYMALKRDNYDAVVPESSHPPHRERHRRGKKGGGTEPLFAFYSRRITAAMEKALIAGRRGLKDFLKTKRVKYIRTEEIIKFDPEAVSFVNLNSPEDIDLYLRPRDRLKFRANTKRRRKCLV